MSYCGVYVSFIWTLNGKGTSETSITYLILRLFVVLHSRADAPRRHAAHVRFLVVKKLDQRGPQTQRLQVVCVIDRFNELLKVIECDKLVLQVDFIGAKGFHGGFHQVGFGGSAEESREHLRREAAGGIGGGIVARVVVIVVFTGGLLLGSGFDTPFKEAVHVGVHGVGVGDGSVVESKICVGVGDLSDRRLDVVGKENR